MVYQILCSLLLVCNCVMMLYTFTLLSYQSTFISAFLDSSFLIIENSHSAFYSLQSDERVYYHDMQDDVTGMDNPTYGGVSPDHSPQVPPPVDRNLIFRNNMNNQASSRRPNNIKVCIYLLIFSTKLSKDRIKRETLSYNLNRRVLLLSFV